MDLTLQMQLMAGDYFTLGSTCCRGYYPLLTEKSLIETQEITHVKTDESAIARSRIEPLDHNREQIAPKLVAENGRGMQRKD